MACFCFRVEDGVKSFGMKNVGAWAAVGDVAVFQKQNVRNGRHKFVEVMCDHYETRWGRVGKRF